MKLQLNAAVEGFPDEAAISVLCELVNISTLTVFVKHGKGNLDKSLSAYNAAAKLTPWFVLRDLDQDASCAPLLCAELMPHPNNMMRFRVVVRAIETWFLADRQRIAAFLSVSIDRIPSKPEDLPNPKQAMIDLARKSGKRELREDMIPRKGSGASEGPAYASRLMEFALFHWRPQVAAKRSDSLHRCIRRLVEFS